MKNLIDFYRSIINNNLVSKKIFFLTLIVVFSFASSLAKENTHDMNISKINWEEYSELKASILNDLNSVAESLKQNEMAFNDKNAVMETLEKFYIENPESLEAFNTAIKEDMAIIEESSFTDMQMHVIHEINSKIETLGEWDLIESYLSCKFEEVAYNNQFSPEERDELLRHITVVDAVSDFMSGATFGAIWCIKVVGAHCQAPPCPPGYLQANPADLFCVTPGTVCCIPFLFLTNLSNSNKGQLNIAEVVCAIYANILYTSIDMS
jgi:hypothetical protein